MATTNLNLTEISSTDLMSAFPTVFNGDMGILDAAIVHMGQVADPDAITKNGIYRVSGVGQILHIQHSTTAAVQLKFPTAGGFVCYRVYASGSWTAWNDLNATVAAHTGSTSNPHGVTYAQTGAMKQWNLLWTNSDPTAQFTAQTVSLDLSGYDAVLISYAANLTATENNATAICLKGCKSTLFAKINNEASYRSRSAEVTASGVVFSGGYTGGTAAAGTSVIPHKIYGIKGII